MTGIEVLAAVLGVTTFLLLIVVLPIYLVQYSFTKAPQKTHWKITDKEILRLIDSQPDKIMTAKKLSALSDLTKSEAGGRLRALSHFKAIRGMTTNKLTTVYTLKEEVDPSETPLLSPEPFITKNDLLKLFKHYKHQLSMHKLIWATNLPAGVIMKELRRFIKDKLIYSASKDMYTSIFLLNEPYLSKPVEEEEDFNIDLDLSRIYEKEIKKYKS